MIDHNRSDTVACHNLAAATALLTRWLINYAGKGAVGMDTCKVVNGDTVIAGEVSAKIEVSCAVL